MIIVGNSRLLLFFLIIVVTLFLLIIFSIIKIIYYKILNKNIKYMGIIEDTTIPSFYVSLIIIVLTFTIKNEEIKIIKLNENKYVCVIVENKSKFNNYELNQLIEKIDIIIEINKSELSLDEKKYFKDKVKNEIYSFIEEKDNNKFKIKN